MKIRDTSALERGVVPETRTNTQPYHNSIKK
jgi:hypothetical protein